MVKVTWRNRRSLRTPTKAFDVSDVRRPGPVRSIDAAVLHELERATGTFQRLDSVD